ncbi:MAG: hypothetical protein BWK78_01165, partial [Thiotrichaceae bacterium IS1]
MLPQPPIRIIHTLAGLKTHAGGPSRTVTSLCEELAKLGTSIEIVTQNFGPASDDNILPKTDLVHTTFVPAISFPKLRIVYSPTYAAALASRCQQRPVQLIHDHG